VPLPQTVLKALELFMLSAAEDAWRELSRGAKSEGNFSVGVFSYEKRLEENSGAVPCEVRVFPIFVKRQLDTWQDP
jgi:hypothetical protein